MWRLQPGGTLVELGWNSGGHVEIWWKPGRTPMAQRKTHGGSLWKSAGALVELWWQCGRLVEAWWMPGGTLVEAGGSLAKCSGSLLVVGT